jgi:hypothetical protein
MKITFFFFTVVLVSAVFSVVAQAFGYGIYFAAITFAMLLPAIAVIFGFACDAERSGRRKVFIRLSLVPSLAFVTSAWEDVRLCLRFGVLHASDAELSRIGIAFVSVGLVAGPALAWYLHRVCVKTFSHEKTA